MSLHLQPSRGEKIFYKFNYILLSIVALGALYPFVYVLASSLSSPEAVAAAKVWLFPIDFTLEAYKKVAQNPQMWIGYANSIFYTVVGTFVSVVLTILGAYPLAKKRLRGKWLFSWMTLLTMWFNPGMIPTYLNLRDLNLLDKRITLIIAFGCTAFYVVLLRTYFQSLPEELEESAKIDGANDLVILSKIILPLSKPAIATISLYYAVQRWNSYFWAMLILKDPNKIPLQVWLKKLIVEMNVGEEMAAVGDMATQISQETVIYATIIIAAIPMIVIYPFIQKYFEKGLMIGSVKG
ncbi:MAG: carbohydrate ABC transporter permease [Epulopiscium sp.]|nr:carbohydrate ABC transporter permease [Candidatus Epulonipiscium sp.]